MPVGQRIHEVHQVDQGSRHLKASLHVRDAQNYLHPQAPRREERNNAQDPGELQIGCCWGRFLGRPLQGRFSSRTQQEVQPLWTWSFLHGRM